MEIAGALLVLLSFLVFGWACLGLINPKWARLRARPDAVGIWVVSALLLGLGGAAQMIAQEQRARAAQAVRDRQGAERAEDRARRTPEEIAAEQARIDAINATNRAEYADRQQRGLAQQPHTTPAEIGDSDGSWCSGYRAIRTSDSGGSSFDQVKALFPSGPNSQTGDTYRWDLAIFGDPVTLRVEFNNADRAVDKSQEGMCY